MKILFLAPQPFFEERGTPINVRLVLRSLTDLGHTVDLLTYPYGADVKIPGVTIRRTVRIPGVGKPPIGPSKEKIVYDMVMSLYAFFMSLFKRYDVIHAVEESVFIALVLRTIFRVPFVFDMDSHMTDQLRYSKFMKMGPLLKFVEWLETTSLKKSACIVTVCSALTDVAKPHTDGKKIFQIEDIPPELPDPPDGVTGVSIRKELKIADDELVALYTGNLESYQGIDLLMNAAPFVALEVPSVRFVIVGGDDKSVKKYKQMAGELAVSRNVIFTGPKPMSHMRPFYDMADILLSPRSEGNNTPLKIYSYLETGKPVVATDMPTHTQVLTNETAQLARPEKMEYARSVLLLLKDEALRNRIGDTARRYVKRNFNYEVFRSKMERAYKNIDRIGGDL